MLSKGRRVENKELCASYHNMPCVVCGSRREIVGHHIKSKGSGGDDSKENLIPVCFIHHAEVHQLGLTKLCSRYSNLKWYIVGLSWYYCPTREKYLNDDVYRTH